jgi:pimeloyl-ACP methyl ester carboxylesterase
MSTYASIDHSGPVRANGLDIYAVRRGQGPDVLLIGGLGDPWESWQAQVDAFSGERRVTAYDNRGMGRTPLPDEPFDIAAMADDAAGLLRALDVDRAHVVGFSMGGAIAQEVALRHPELVRSLVLNGTFARIDRHFGATMRLWRWIMESAPSERELLDGWLTWVYTRRAYADGFVDQTIEAMLGDPHAPSLEAMQRSIDAILRHDTLDRLHRIEVPTLVLVGDEDISCPPVLNREIAARIPNARLEVLQGHAHQPFQEDPGLWNRHVEAFWREVETA